MAPRIRPRPKVRPKLNVTVTSSRAELKQALDQARAAKIEADKSGTPQQKRKTHAKYLEILQMQPEVFPTGKGGVSIRNLTTKEQVKTGNLKPLRDKPIPLGKRLAREQDADAGEKPISDYIKEKYPNKKKSVSGTSLGKKREEALRKSEKKMEDLGYDLDDLDDSNPFKIRKKGGKITYKMTGGQVVSHSYD